MTLQKIKRFILPALFALILILNSFVPVYALTGNVNHILYIELTSTGDVYRVPVPSQYDSYFSEDAEIDYTNLNFVIPGLYNGYSQREGAFLIIDPSADRIAYYADKSYYSVFDASSNIIKVLRVMPTTARSGDKVVFYNNNPYNANDIVSDIPVLSTIAICDKDGNITREPDVLGVDYNIYVDSIPKEVSAGGEIDLSELTPYVQYIAAILCFFVIVLVCYLVYKFFIQFFN